MITEFESHTISFLLESIDKVGANLVVSTYNNLVYQYSPLFFTLTAVYIGFVFIKMMRGHYDANDFVMLILRAVIILTLVLNYGYFCLFIYDIFTNAPLELCKAITINNGSVESVSVSYALDNFLKEGREAVAKIFSLGSWTNPTYTIFGVILFIMILITSAFAAGLIVLAKCASTVLLGLSPIFIFFALYDSTKGLFESYIRQLITYALIPVMTCTILMILLSVSNSAIDSLKTHITSNFISLIPLGLMCIIQVFLLLQVKAKCAAISGGFAMPSVISALKQSKAEIQSVGNKVSSMASTTYKQAGAAALKSRQFGRNLAGRMTRFNK